MFRSEKLKADIIAGYEIKKQEARKILTFAKKCGLNL